MDEDMWNLSYSKYVGREFLSKDMYKIYLVLLIVTACALYYLSLVWHACHKL